MANSANVISNIDYSRQEVFRASMRGIEESRDHVIVGCGGIGYWLGILLALHGVPKLLLIDGDEVDSSNLNRLPVPVAWRGFNKAIALRKTIKALRPEMTITVLPSRIEGMLASRVINGYSSCTQIWDCTDHMPTQQALFKMCKDTGHKYRKIGYEGFEIGTYVDYSVWATTDTTEQHGYRTSAANAISSVMAACLGMLAQGMQINADVNMNIADIIPQAASTTRRELCPTNGQQD